MRADEQEKSQEAARHGTNAKDNAAEREYGH